MAGVTFTAEYRILDTAYRIRAGPEAGREVDRLLAPFRLADRWGAGTPRRVTITAGDDGSRVLEDGRVIAEGFWPGLLGPLMAHLNTAVLEEFAGLAVHAGVVAEGPAALAFPGASGSGKSTLTAACLLTGFSYVSDEALCLDRLSGQVVPYPKPLALAGPGTQALRLSPSLWEGAGGRLSPSRWEGAGGRLSPSRWEGAGGTEMLLQAEDLGARLASGPLEAAHVVTAERAMGPARLVEVTPSQAMAALLRFSFNHYKDPEGSFRLAARVAGGCRAWQLRYEDPLEAARLLRRSLVPAGSYSSG
ncbi:MAG: hypothetical protein ACRDXD_00930 [Acidimicrobiia bacterium]